MNTVENVWIVVSKEWREQQSKSLRRTLLGIPLLLMFVVFMIARDMPPSLLETFVGLPMKFIVLGATIMVEGMLAGPIFSNETVTRSIESLLSTPLGLKHILSGKAAVASIVGIGVAAIVGVGTVVIISLHSAAGTVIWPPVDSLFFIVVVVPIIAFGFSAFIGSALMFGVPPSAVNGITMLVAIVLFALPSRLTRLGANGWSTDTMFAAMGLLILIVDVALFRSLSPERVVTGSKPTTQRL